jgi:hypothetical protein
VCVCACVCVCVCVCVYVSERERECVCNSEGVRFGNQNKPHNGEYFDRRTRVYEERAQGSLLRQKFAPPKKRAKENKKDSGGSNTEKKHQKSHFRREVRFEVFSCVL